MAEHHTISHVDRHGEEDIRSIALISNQAFSMLNFRGPLIQALIERGIHVFALAPDFDTDTRKAVSDLGAEPVDISLDRTGMKPLRDILDIVKLVHRLRRLQADAVFGYFIKPVIYGSIAARLAGVPHRFALVAGLGYTFTPDGQRLTLKRRILRSLVSSLYRIGFRACDKVFFQNDDDIEHFVSCGALPVEKAVRVAGTGVDLNKLSPVPAVTSPITFLLMARLLREKGIAEYAAAASLVKQKHPGTRFILLGDLDTNPGAITRAEVEGWVDEGLLEWPGHVADVRPWIAQSSVYVLPSYREGVPRSTQEAMAMGKPVITTDAVGCRETVINGQNGFLVPVRDAEALAKAMICFISDPRLIKEMGEAGRRLAEEKFDVHKINAKIISVMGIENLSPLERHAEKQT